jgi:hypothetical protein
MEKSIIDKVGAFLGEENIRWFAHVKGLKGEIDAVLRLNMKRKFLPVHPIHLREGMQIRNFMRGLPECKHWPQDTFEHGWIEVVEELIKRHRK